MIPLTQEPSPTTARKGATSASPAFTDRCLGREPRLALLAIHLANAVIEEGSGHKAYMAWLSGSNRENRFLLEPCFQITHEALYLRGISILRKALLKIVVAGVPWKGKDSRAFFPMFVPNHAVIHPFILNEFQQPTMVDGAKQAEWLQNPDAHPQAPKIMRGKPTPSRLVGGRPLSLGCRMTVGSAKITLSVRVVFGRHVHG